MLKITDADNFRRTMAGLCLIAAPPILLAGDRVIALSEEDTASGEIAAIAAGNPTGWLIGSLVFLLGLITLLPAILGLVHLLRHRGVVLGHIGGGLATLGILGFVGLNALNYVLLEFATSDMNEAQSSALSGGMGDNAGYLAITLMMMVGFYLGFILLAVGLWRGRVAPIWVAVSIVLSVVVLLIGGGGIFNAVGFTLLAVGFGWIGLKVLATSDADWARGHVLFAGEVRAGTQPRVQ